MTFLHPDRPTAPHTIQAGVFGADLDEIIAGFRGTGVRTGCTVTAAGLSVNVAAGVVFINGQLIPVSAQTVGPVAPAGGTLYRWYLVEVDGFGGAFLRAGNPSNWDLTTTPVKPRPPTGRCVLADVLVGPTIAALSAANDITPRQIPFLRPPVRHYYLREWGVTPASTPTAITAAFNTALPWIATNVPGASLIVDIGTWNINGDITIRSRCRLIGEDLEESIIRCADGVGGDVYMLHLDDSAEQHDIKIGNLTLEGNRANLAEAHGSGGIQLTSGLSRRWIRIKDVRILNPYYYGIACSGIGSKEFIWYESVYVENSGSDGFDCRGAVPWDRHLYARDCTVNGFGFIDDFSAAGFDIRGSWDVQNCRVEMCQRIQHVGIRHRTGQFDGGGTRYPSMFSTISGGMVAPTGGPIANAFNRGSQGQYQMPGHPDRPAIPIATGRPVPVPVEGMSSDADLASYSFPMSFVPKPFRVVEVCVVTRTAATPTSVTWGGGTLQAIPNGTADSGANYRMTRYSTMYAWSTTNDAMDFSNSFAVRLATAAALPAHTYNSGAGTLAGTGTLTVDGTAVAVGDQIVVKNETAGNAPRNGIYILTQLNPWILTRPNTANSSGELLGPGPRPLGTEATRGAFALVGNTGTVNKNTGWAVDEVATPDPINFTTTPIVWRVGIIQEGGSFQGDTYARKPSIPIISPPFVQSNLVVNFSTTQQWCYVGVLMWEYASAFCGKQDLGGDGVWDSDYGRHGEHAFRNTISHAATASAGVVANTNLPAFENFSAPIDLLPDGSIYENVAGAWFFNTIAHAEVAGTSGRLLVETADCERVLQHLGNDAVASGAAGDDPLKANTGHCLTYLYKPHADLSIGGTQGTTADIFIVSASEVRGAIPW